MAILSTYPNISDPYKQGIHSGLDFSYGAGQVRNGTTISLTAASTVTIADDDTSYIEVDPADGVVSDNITGFTAGKIPLYEVTAASGAITTVVDKRAFLVDVPDVSGFGTGDVTGDSASTAGNIAIFSDATGKAIEDSGHALSEYALDADLDDKSDALLSLSAQTDSYTLALADAGKLVQMGKATAQTLTVPKNSSVAFEVGTQILVEQSGAGQVTIAPVDGDVTLQSADSALKTVKQYSVAGLVKLATNTWLVMGDVEA